MPVPVALLSLHVFATLSDEERLELAKTIAGLLGADYRPKSTLCGATRLAAVVHVPTGVELVVVPGGTYVAGLRPEEIEQMRAIEYVEEEAFESVESLAHDAKPRVVTVAPFLCARAPLLRDDAWKMLGAEKGWVVGDDDSGASPIRFDKKTSGALIEKTPFRLLTPAEWEWLAREGGRLAFVNAATPERADAACAALYDRAYDPERVDEGTNAFAVWGLNWGGWIAEAKSPRTPHEERGGAAMLYPWQSDEIVMQLCAFGDGGNDESCIRFALDFPKERRVAQKKAPTISSSATMMAIVSKAVFEKEMPKAKVGDLYTADRYRSSGKALAPLAGGGTLYLVTVRPNEELWLVAVLENVEEGEGAWIAPKGNATPIRKITELRGKLKFANGKGISSEAGAMAMSLQTPRTLTADDVALLSRE